MRPLWLKQTSGIRNDRGHEVYTRCRRIGTSGDADHGEISKTYWDARA